MNVEPPVYHSGKTKVCINFAYAISGAPFYELNEDSTAFLTVSFLFQLLNLLVSVVFVMWH